MTLVEARLEGVSEPAIRGTEAVQIRLQALERTQPMLPLKLGQATRHRQDFLAFMKHVARSFPEVELHVIIDNSSTHTTPAVMEWLR